MEAENVDDWKDTVHPLTHMPKLIMKKGKMTGATIRRHNFKNEQAIGKKGYERMKN